MPLGAEALAPDVGCVLECGGGIAEDRMELDGEIGALVLEQQRCVLRGRVAVGDRRQRFNIDVDQPERIFGDACAVGEHEGEHLADVAHLGLGDHRLPERFEIRQRLQPHGNAGHAVADVLGREHAMHAGKRAGGAKRRSSGCGRGRPSCAGTPRATCPCARDRRHIARGRGGSADPRGVRSRCR